jgi:pimeloyl-ACP methyl ester carboxylesterase
VFSLAAPTSSIEVVDLVLNMLEPGRNYTAEVLSGYATVSGNYSIAATYCTPDSGAGRTLQVLTHGIAFDRAYWDFPFRSGQYSYVDAALARNYSTFAFDRLGLGGSSRGDPVNEIQVWLEIAALHALTARLRAGAVRGVDALFDKIVHVGHSFGSTQTYGFTAAYPNASDGIALTGFTQSAVGGPPFQYGANWVPAKGVPTHAGYADENNFFAPGNFEPEILGAAYAAGQPVTVGELLTKGSPASPSVPNAFAGPVLVITGGE